MVLDSVWAGGHLFGKIPHKFMNHQQMEVQYYPTKVSLFKRKKLEQCCGNKTCVGYETVLGATDVCAVFKGYC